MIRFGITRRFGVALNRHAVLGVAVLCCAWPLPGLADVVINEIHYHPASEDEREEFIELHNTGTEGVNVGGWAFTNGIRFTLPVATTIPAGGFLVVAADATVFAGLHPEVTNVVAGWSGILSNSANKLTLVEAAGATVDEVHYADDGDWGVRRKDWWSSFGHKGLSWDSGTDGRNDPPPYSNAPADILAKNRSLELVNVAFDNSTGQNWLASLAPGGTPGAANSVAAADIAPVIRDVAHFPVIPKSSDPVYITARVADDHGLVPAVNAYWRTDGGGAFSVAAMADDGLHGDTLAGDGIFGASLPVQPNGTIIEFYVSATDGTLSRTWPAPVFGDDAALTPQQTAGCLYQVDDTVYAGAMPIYRLVMKAADKTELAYINSGGTGGSHPYPFYTGESNDQTFSHARFNASFVSVDGTGTELRYQVGIRNRGNGSRSKQPQGLNVMFPNGDPWNGVTQLNLNTQYTPWQVFGAVLFAQAGVPAPQSRAVQVRWNSTNPTAGTGSPSYGFVACNEAWNSDLADHRFPNDSSGNLYRGIRLFEGTTTGGTAIPNAADFSKIVPGATETLSLVELYKLNYKKQTNTAEDSWTDLIGLTAALAKGHSGALATAAVTYDADYVAAVRAVADVEEWMRWFAVNTLVDNSETNLSNGDGDDFNFYCGVTDPRCKLMPYDLDTILGGGDTAGSATASVFRMIARGSGAATPMNAFMKHPEFAPIYYAALKTLLDGAFKPAHFDPLAQQTLGGLVNQAVIDSMKSYNSARNTYIASQIPLAMSVTTFPTVASGYPKSATATTTLGGKANALSTRAVKVNGTAAAWTAWAATWSAPGVALNPGLNRVLIQSFDVNGGETERMLYDVWYDDSSVASVSGTLAADTTWTAAGGPYAVTASLTVPAGVTLTIEPGTTVYLASGVELTVNDGGRIVAEGTATAPIRFSRTPGTTASWGGIVINGSTTGASPMTVFRNTHFEYNAGIVIHAQSGAEIELEALSFGTTTEQYLSLDSSSFLIRDCVFPTASAGYYYELVHGAGGIKTGGRGIFLRNFFGVANSIPGDYNDVIDFTGGQRPGPIFQMIDNVFIGSGDDLVDLDGTDAWLEGNVFMHCHRNGSPDSASAISGGDDSGDTSEITIVGNVFYDVDHAVTAKQGNYYNFSNNTVVRQTISGGTEVEGGVINLRDTDPTPTVYGLGLYAEANILSDCAQLLRNYDPAQSTVTLNNNLMDFAWTGPGGGNTRGDPLFQYVPTLADTIFSSWSAAQVMKQWLALKGGSPAHGTGPNGRDQGGLVGRGICLAANVPATTDLTAATLSVGPLPAAVPTWQSGYTHYRWRLDGGVWSTAVPIATPLVLTDLAAGSHTVDAAGLSDAGYWQDDAVFGTSASVASFSWTIDPGYVPPGAAPLVQINEVLAKNVETLAYGTTYPDLIELHNAGNATADLGGWGLTDNTALPYKYMFPVGTSLAPGAYLVIPASNAAAVPPPKTGFGIKDQGDTLTLTRAGGGVADQVAYGNQLADYSIGRRPGDGAWDLCRPTFGTANVAASQGDARNVMINEWLASAGVLSTTDFIELFNSGNQPVNLGGCYLTDNPGAWPNQHQIHPLTFAGAGGLVVFKADGDAYQGADHLSFKLATAQGEIGLFDGALALIDAVIYGPQSTDVSQGRSPNGGSAIVLFTQLTPGGPNPGSTVATGTTTTNLLGLKAVWKYKASATDYSGLFQAVAFDDSAWPSGAQILHYETGTLNSASGFAKTTQIPITGTIPYKTNYFRAHFTWNGSTDGVVLRATTMIDDGAVIYLNGQEAVRIRIAAGAVTFGTYSDGAPGSGTEAIEETIYLPTHLLVQGDNVIAAEVHQANATSSDVVWGMKLDADVTTTIPAALVVINEVLVRNETLTNPDGSLAAWVELYNPSATAADISDMSLSTAPAAPRSWVAPGGTVIPAGGHLVVQCDAMLPASATNTGFGFDPVGGGIYLFHTLTFGGGLRGSVVWGNQLPDLSVGRVPNGTGALVLNLPTRGALNNPAATGPLTDVRINEWLASPATGADWFELFNTGSLPVLLGGNYLTDTLSNKTKQLIAPLTFIGGSGPSRWLQFIADNDPATPGHVNFALSSAGEALGVFAASGFQLDALAFGPQTTAVSQGRFPDGTGAILAMLPTPAAANALPNPDADGDSMPDEWETSHGLNPGSSADAALDADGDGMTNLQEYLAGTDPQDAASRFVVALTRDGGVPTVRFVAQAGRGYTVQFSDNLGTWAKLADVAPPAVTGEVAVGDPAAVGQPQRFYRVLTPTQP